MERVNAEKCLLTTMTDKILMGDSSSDYYQFVGPSARVAFVRDLLIVSTFFEYFAANFAENVGGEK